jgi:hypothetical protein
MPFAVASDWPKRASSRRSVAVATASILALAETINGLYKAELIHRRTWKTRESVELATLEWVAWVNHHRLMEPLSYIPPAEADANYYRQLEHLSLNPINLNQPASTIPGAVQYRPCASVSSSPPLTSLVKWALTHHVSSQLACRLITTPLAA